MVHILAIDQGTTGSTALAISTDGRVLKKSTRDFPQHFPAPGWVEHEPEEIWNSVLGALADLYGDGILNVHECKGIGITNQRETTLMWKRSDGSSLGRAIVWQDRRTSERCKELRDQGKQEWVQAKTGLVLDPYFSATKMEWILKNREGAQGLAERGELLAGTIDSFLVFRLSGGAAHITDTTNASRTMLFDIEKCAWDDELLELFGVPKNILPQVRESSEVYATTKGVPGLPDGIPIAGIAGDQQAALFGQTCFEDGDAKCTYGTGAFLLMNSGTRRVASKHGLLTTVAWTLNGKTEYALEGSAFIAGAAVQWLRDGLGLIKHASDIEALAATVKDADGVFFVPALAGLGAPYWDADARGLLCGLTRGTTRGHIARATLEGIAFQVAELALAMEADTQKKTRALRVDGGAASNGLLMEFQANILGTTIERPSSVETTAIGAAYLAGLAVGIFKDQKEIKKVHQISARFEPTFSEAERSSALDGYRNAVKRARS